MNFAETLTPTHTVASIDWTHLTPDLLVSPPPRPEFQLANEILQSVADKHGLTIADIKAEDRRRHVVHARHEAMARVKDMLGWSLPRIARLLGNRDHTTILYGIKQHRARVRERARMQMWTAKGLIG